MDFNLGSPKRIGKNKSSFSWQFGSEPNMFAHPWWRLMWRTTSPLHPGDGPASLTFCGLLRSLLKYWFLGPIQELLSHRIQGRGWTSDFLIKTPLMQFLAKHLRQAHVAYMFHIGSLHPSGKSISLPFGEPLSPFCGVKKSMIVGHMPLAHPVRCAKSEVRIGKIFWSPLILQWYSDQLVLTSVA